MNSVTDLGTMGGGSTEATGLNGQGTAVGNILVGGTVTTQAGYVSQGGASTRLKGLTTTGWSRAADLNDLGWIAGDAASASGQGHAVLWKNGVARDLGVPSGYTSSYATGVNNAGQVVGSASNTARFRVAVLVTGGRMRIVGPGGSAATGINDAGLVVGNAMPTAGGPINCWSLTAAGVAQYLPKLGGANCTVSAVNAAGDIVGSSQVASGESHAVLYRQGQLVDLGGLGGTTAVALGLNNLGVIVGTAQLPGGTTHGALFTAGGQAVDLNTLLDAGSAGYEIVDARRVNDLGTIAGAALVGGVRHSVLLHPLP